MMKVIKKLPGKQAEFAFIDGTLESIQEAVDGYFRPVALFDGLVMLCNDDGNILGMQPNFPIQTIGMIVGPVIFVREEKDNYVSVAESDMRKLSENIGFLEMGLPVDG